ncbi:MAG: hypothetical protein ACOY90_01020 [Candidatus Zhuqueibacterota bacterium]
MEKISKFVRLLIVLSLLSCDMDPSVVETNFISYTPLQVGDFTQMIFLDDSSTITFGIVGTKLRADGMPTFIGEWQDGTFSPDTFYYFLKDGYFGSTELDTVTDDWLMRLLNPFREQKLAKSQPHPGDGWRHTLGDTDSTHWIARAEKPLDTFAGRFDNVFGFYLYPQSGSSHFMKTYYGLDVGWLATAGSDVTGIFALCSYKKVGGKTFGALWPAKNPASPDALRKQHRFIQDAFFSGLFLWDGSKSSPDDAIK